MLQKYVSLLFRYFKEIKHLNRKYVLAFQVYRPFPPEGTVYDYYLEDNDICNLDKRDAENDEPVARQVGSLATQRMIGFPIQSKIIVLLAHRSLGSTG